MGIEFKKIYPAKGLIVRDSRTKAILPITGTTVPWTGPEGRYWRRRLAVGDITLGNIKPEVKKEPEISLFEENDNKKIKGGYK